MTFPKRSHLPAHAATLALVACLGAVPATAGARRASAASSGGAGVANGPSAPSTPANPTVPGPLAKIVRGVAYAPADAPDVIKKAIWAGNRIRKKPYVWGGGHAHFRSDGYDCSGSVSYLLHAAGLLKTPMDSSEFDAFGESGGGTWITVYTNPDHAFVEIAGIRLDTSAAGDPHPTHESGPRWRPLLDDTSGYDARHPLGY